MDRNTEVKKVFEEIAEIASSFEEDPLFSCYIRHYICGCRPDDERPEDDEPWNEEVFLTPSYDEEVPIGDIWRYNGEIVHHGGWAFDDEREPQVLVHCELCARWRAAMEKVRANHPKPNFITWVWHNHIVPYLEKLHEEQG